MLESPALLTSGFWNQDGCDRDRFRGSDLDIDLLFDVAVFAKPDFAEPFGEVAQRHGTRDGGFGGRTRCDVDHVDVRDRTAGRRIEHAKNSPTKIDGVS